jgi:hypothetical protein
MHPEQGRSNQTPPLVRAAAAVLRAAATVLVIAYEAAAAIFTPLLRPIWQWLAGLTLFRAIGDWIGRQPPYVVLVLLGVPFCVIEPGKYLALFWMATGHLVGGGIALVFAHVLSLLVCERIFHAGYEPLTRIDWFNRLFTWLIALRDRALGWLRATSPWRRLREAWVDVRRWFAAIRPRRRQ